MEDVSAARRRNMAAIKGKDTKPEMLVRRYLHAQGLRFRLHKQDLPGRPDITLPKYQTVIFVHGCFWHCHEGCKNFRLPLTRRSYWSAKLSENAKRDRISGALLAEQGWRVIEIWECELKGADSNIVLSKVVQTLKDITK